MPQRIWLKYKELLPLLAIYVKIIYLKKNTKIGLTFFRQFDSLISGFIRGSKRLLTYS